MVEPWASVNSTACPVTGLAASVAELAQLIDKCPQASRAATRTKSNCRPSLSVDQTNKRWTESQYSAQPGN